MLSEVKLRSIYVQVQRPSTTEGGGLDKWTNDGRADVFGEFNHQQTRDRRVAS